MNTPLSSGVLCALGLVLVACSSYNSAPVNLSRDTTQWLQVSRNLTSQSSSLKHQQLQRIGLFLNPELNAKRLTYAQKTSVARYAGLWADPIMGADFGNVLSSQLRNYSLAPEITIPVTGLPRIAKQIAEQYKEADFWEMKATEQSYLATLEEQCVSLLLGQRQERLISQRLKQLRDEVKKVDSLHTLGELSFAEKQIAHQRLNELITMLQNKQDEVLNARLNLVRELGLHPATKNLRVQDFLPQSTPAPVATLSAQRLLASPSLKAAAAQFNASELELKSEIRKQYPELTLLPSFSGEGNEAGLGFEFTLPLWNRNREAIALSTGERALKTHAYITAWRRLLTESQSLQAQERLSLQHCRSEASRIAELKQAVQTQQKLYDLGELKLAELSEMRHESFLRELSYLENLAVLLKTQAKLKYLNPHFTL